MSTWIVDAAHSTIGFKIKHLMVSQAKGSFGSFQGSIESPDDSFEHAVVRFSADVSSVQTGQADRDGHLRSPDFFDAEKFPKIE
ncbi:MAG TPA: YceI family protein, partial [Verrucomicrobiae bacterium]|nr:YceI family protein [Verrucomicrobiae bacterium]